MTIQVLIIAHSIVVQAGLEVLLSHSAALTVVGTAPHLSPDLIDDRSPDVILLEYEAVEEETLAELTMPDLLFSELAEFAAADGSGFDDDAAPAIVVLIEEGQPQTIAALLKAKVQGILPKDATPDEIISAIEAVAAGLIVLHPEIALSLLPLLPAAESSSMTLEKPLDQKSLEQPLTPREMEVLQMMSEGLSNKTIARRLTISEHTVKFHVGSIFSKLQAASRTEAVAIGVRQGLILL